MSKIVQGDSLEKLKELATDSIDFICTDPPYGYSFMGKDWDKAVPSTDIWKECLRVLKPGAFCCVMSAPRSDVQAQMITKLQDAGFRLDFTPIYWTYASGFPKAANIGKLVDKRKGLERKGLERKGAGTQGNTFPLNQTYETGEPVSDEAKALDGSYAGFQPKPAVEVIIVAMKPLSEKTFVDQALANGHGVSWLDGCRIPTTEDLNGGAYQDREGVVGTNQGQRAVQMPQQVVQPFGRFPANLLVSDDVLNDGTYTKDTGHFPKTIKATSYFSRSKRTQLEQKLTGGGSYSRYFDLDKWAQTLPFLIAPKASKGEKNKGLEEFTGAKTNDGRAKEIDNAYQRGSTLRKNHHPTVKPLKLMSYLITLFSREGDTVLDPFVGSGTTVIAATKLNRYGVGIEREFEYVEIACARLEAEDNG